MVHKHCSTRKATAAKDVSPMRNTFSVNKMSSSPSGNGGFQFGFGSRLSVPVAVRTPAPAAPSADKWAYNNMVNNSRDQFNNLHHC